MVETILNVFFFSFFVVQCIFGPFIKTNYNFTIVINGFFYLALNKKDLIFI